MGKRPGSYDRQLVIPSPGILRSLRVSRPDLVIVQELLGYAMYLALFRRHLPSTRLLLLLESDPIRQMAHRGNRWVRMVRRWAVHRMDWCLTNNESGKNYLIQELGFPAERIVARPYLVSQPPQSAQPDMSAPDEVPASLPAAVRRDLGKTIFLTVGQLIERKGIRQWIEAVAALEDPLCHDARFWIIGDGAMRQELEQLTVSRGLQPFVRFLGPIPYEQLAWYYRTADCFVMPTLDDYRALVGFEALSHGLPLLHSCHDGAARELVVDGENGYVIDPRDARAFAGRMGDLLRRRDDLPAMGRASRRRAEQHFTPQRAVDNLTSAIVQVLTHADLHEAGQTCAS